MNETPSSPPFTAWHALAWLLSFFGLMFAVNGVFLYHAIVSFPGEDIPKSYVQGLNYNSVLEARASQAELDWSAEIGVRGSVLVFRLSDHSGAPVGWRRVEVTLRRLATTADDTVVVLTPKVAGEYEAALDHLAPGEWEAIASVFAPGDEWPEFVARKQVSIR
ncbi:MAG: FixH family protein [Pseudomonadota bacterium]